MAPSSLPASPVIKTLDFDANRTAQPHASGHRSLLDDDVSLMSEVAEGIIARDRQLIRAQFIRTCSFICAVLSWYASLLPTLSHTALDSRWEEHLLILFLQPMRWLNNVIFAVWRSIPHRPSLYTIPRQCCLRHR